MLFTTKEVAGLCELHPRLLSEWVERSYVTPVIRGRKGGGKYHRLPHQFSARQVIGLIYAMALSRMLGVDGSWACLFVRVAQEETDEDLFTCLSNDGLKTGKDVMGVIEQFVIAATAYKQLTQEETEEVWAKIRTALDEVRERLSGDWATVNGRKKTVRRQQSQQKGKSKGQASGLFQ